MTSDIKPVSGIRSAANVLTLIGAILQTIIWAFIIIVTVGIGSIVAIPLIILAWVTYNKTKNFIKGWNIYGIVQSICFCDMVGLSGYILALVDLSNIEREKILVQKDEAFIDVKTNPLQEELNQVNAEIAMLKHDLNKEGSK